MCEQLAQAAEHQTPPDVTRAKRLYTLACDGKQFSACYALAQLSPDKEKLLELACTNGVMPGCSDLGVIESEHGDHAKALEHLNRACDGGHARACTNIGMAFAKGLGVDADPAKALAQYEKACAMNERNACAIAGEYWLKGKAGSKDEERARTLTKKACDLGDARACADVAN
jgi:TPR repeat protein